MAAGLSRSSLYYYFAGKDDVLAFLLRSMLDDLADSSLAAAAVDGDAPTKLRAVIVGLHVGAALQEVFTDATPLSETESGLPFIQRMP